MTSSSRDQPRGRGRPLKKSKRAKLVTSFRGRIDDVAFGVIKTEARNGRTPTEIAQLYQVSRGTVRNVIASATPPSRRNRPKPTWRARSKKAKEIAKRDTLVKHLVTRREVRTCGKRSKTTLPNHSCGKVARDISLERAQHWMAAEVRPSCRWSAEAERW